MSDLKFYGVVVTFQPTKEHLMNINEMAKDLDGLYLVDNSVDFSDLSLLQAENITILNNNNKNGIAGALNAGLKELLEKKGFVFLFDQDSSLPSSFVKNQSKFILENKVKCVVPRYFDVNSKTYGNYTSLKRFTIKNIMGKSLLKPTSTTFAITSGSLYSLDIFKKAGLMEEGFFIDHVDSEFCVRMKYFGFKVLINPDVVFNHSIGERKLKSFLGVNFKPNFHKPTRRYYAVRNGIFMLKLWGRKYPSLYWLLFLRNVYEFLGILLFENNRLAKFKALFLGLYDGIFNNSGKCYRSFE